MKKLLLFLSAALFSAATYAQSPTFNQGDLVFNLGVGIGTSLYSGTGYKATLPPLSVSGEYGVADDFLTDDLTLGIGGYLGIAGSKYETAWAGYTYGYKYTYTVIGARGTLHYPLVDNFDTYAGLMLGYNVVNYKETGNWPTVINGNDATGSTMAFSIYVGGRYYFSDNFAAMAELGYGIAYLNLGVALKL